MSLFERLKNKRENLRENKKNNPGDALRKAIGKQAELDAAKDFQKDVGRKITPELKNTLNKKQDNLNRFFTDKPDSETLKTKSTGDEKQFKKISKVKFDSGAKGKFASGSPDLGGTQKKFVKDRRKKLDVEINKRRSAELTKADAINRSMSGSSSTEGTGGANQGSAPLKKGKPFTKAESDAIQIRSLNKKTKQFVNKPGTTKSKGGGATTGGQKNLVVNPKSKGTTPVKVNVTKPIKQSEVSKKAKKFTTKINKANKNRSEFSQNLKKIKGSETGKPISTGDIGFTAPDRQKKIQKRLTRATKLGTPDPFKIDTSKAAKEVAKDLGVEPVKGGLDMGKSTLPSKAKKLNKMVSKSTPLPGEFKQFEKKLKKYKSDVAKSKSTPKPKKTNVFKRVTAATSGKKVTNSKGIGNKFRGQENIAARNAEIIKRGGSVTGGGGKPPKPPGNVTFSAADFPDDNSRKIVKKFNTGSTGKITVSPQTRALMSKQQTFAKSAIGKGMRKNLPTLYKAAIKNPIARQVTKKAIKAAPVAAIPLGLLASPYARTAIKGALLGGGLSAFKSKKEPVAKLSKEKKIGKTVKFSLSPNQKA